jgi:hypothetical protein
MTLTATPATGSTFTGWSGGGCSATGACALTLTAATTVTATFAPQLVTLTVSKTGAGSGTVTSAPAGISCGATCAGSYASGTAMTLTATPATGSTFTGWSGGGCSATGSCSLTLTTATTVTATFALLPATSFSDDFARPDSTVLGRGWTEPRGDFFISGGKLWNGKANTLNLAMQESLVMAAGHLTADFTSVSNSGAPAFGLLFGYRDPLNYYAAYRQAGGSALLKIVRVVNGVETVLASVACPNPGRQQAFQLAVSFSANQISVSAAGGSVSASGVAVSAGGVGLMVRSGGRSHSVDNFVATP